jgi:hypothetical protein
MAYKVDIVASRDRKIRLIKRVNPDGDNLDDRLSGHAIGSRQQVPGRQPWLWQ